MGVLWFQSFNDNRIDHIKTISKELNIDKKIVEEEYDKMLDNLKEYVKQD